MKKILDVLATVAGWAFVSFLYYSDAIRTGEVCGIDGGCQIVTTPSVTPGWTGYFTVMLVMTVVVATFGGIFVLAVRIQERMKVRKFAKWCMDNDRDPV